MISRPVRDRGIIHLHDLPPAGIWRLTATLTARGTADLVELRSEAEANDHDTLVLRGRGVLDRGTLALGKPPWPLSTVPPLGIG